MYIYIKQICVCFCIFFLSVKWQTVFFSQPFALPASIRFILYTKRHFNSPRCQSSCVKSVFIDRSLHGPLISVFPYTRRYKKELKNAAKSKENNTFLWGAAFCMYADLTKTLFVHEQIIHTVLIIIKFVVFRQYLIY